MHRFARFAVAVVSLLAATACGIPKEQYDKDMAKLRADLGQECKGVLDNERSKCEAEKQALESSARDAAQKAADELERTKKALNDCTSAGGDKAKALAGCQMERDEARQRLARVQESINKVRGALQAMADAGKLQVKVQRGFLVIALAGDILFDSGKAKLKEEAKPVLLELAGVLKQLPDRMFQVAGHTDNMGAEDLNWELSMQRALTVVKFLIKDGGVGGQQLSAGGYAMYQPVADNAADAGRQINRRVEFLLIPNLSELLNLGK